MILGWLSHREACGDGKRQSLEDSDISIGVLRSGVQYSLQRSNI